MTGESFYLGSHSIQDVIPSSDNGKGSTTLHIVKGCGSPPGNGPPLVTSSLRARDSELYFTMNLMVATMAMSLLQCCWILVASVFFHAAAKTPLNLTFVLVTSYGRYGFNSSGTLPAADIALERINNRPDLLPGYNLVYDTVRNSEV